MFLNKLLVVHPCEFLVPHKGHKFMNYEPTVEAVMRHPLPGWYQDAKLGIFVHWGLFSVPGWAPHGTDIDKQVAEKGWDGMFANNPYAEWYLNTLRVGDTPTHRHHVQTYGHHFAYDNFAPIFLQESEKWNPDVWAELFQKIGARYVVLTTKHHDGFLLWPSSHTSPYKPYPYATKRDIVGELTDAVRSRNMRMGLYYSGGLDWSFNQRPVRDYMDVYSTVIQSPDFVEYATAHWRELIDRYSPSVLWNDIGYPAAANLAELFAYYYKTVPEGVVNDRWSQKLPERIPGAGEMINPPPAFHYDFTTPEYASYNHITETKWEATRGIGHSYGYNQNEGDNDYLSVEELVRSFADIVSKNGNLLLNVGPMADGTIPELQRQRLLGLGAWLDINGEAIFGTRPWIVAEGQTNEDIGVRYTKKDDVLHAILLNTPHSRQMRLNNLAAAEGSTVHLLGHRENLDWTQHGDDLMVELPEAIKTAPAYVLKITPTPYFSG
jgi:alpha-L-fucosidase